MTTASNTGIFLRAALDGAPFMLVVAPFGLLFGVISTEAGLSLAEVIAFSVLVIAGAAQFTALQLMLEHAPTLLILAAGLVVNLRMAMYAAALAPHLGAAPLRWRLLMGYFNFDQSFALGLQAYEAQPAWSMPQKIAYFLGVALPLGGLWVLVTWLGAVTGAIIPDNYALDFAMPITFLALVAPGLKSPAHMAAAATSIALALALAWLPAGLGLILAAMAAMAVGAEVERRGAGP
ncbi:AzlC family protein [Candidatus Rhodobacter oscarellae]|uniref:AzlC family protein n=1 Tax=Candidatus Rhodobacter oscarellae TaxID=1675527 RepID=A0A0J9E765_9RHOB|nr:AzlC family ABC transporter permease [Candidatus Rhodobacter lobularis]KMW58557.1 AzlC family protein [Candidatus Rhodobacter lobularis]